MRHEYPAYRYLETVYEDEECLMWNNALPTPSGIRRDAPCKQWKKSHALYSLSPSLFRRFIWLWQAIPCLEPSACNSIDGSNGTTKASPTLCRRHDSTARFWLVSKLIVLVTMLLFSLPALHLALPTDYYNGTVSRRLNGRLKRKQPTATNRQARLLLPISGLGWYFIRKTFTQCP
jgi:hypothetical protein